MPCSTYPDTGPKYPKSLGGFIESTVAQGTQIITDDWSGYASLSNHGYDHVSITERGDPQVTEAGISAVT